VQLIRAIPILVKTKELVPARENCSPARALLDGKGRRVHKVMSVFDIYLTRQTARRTWPHLNKPYYISILNVSLDYAISGMQSSKALNYKTTT